MSAIRPALTPEEWKGAVEVGLDIYRHSHSGNPNPLSIREFQENLELRWSRSPHWVAALALHDQPFGFTQEDVVRLLAIVPWNEEAERWCHSLV